MVEFVDYVKKLMGWCPQKGFDFADARREKHELYDDKFYQKDSHAAKGVTSGEKLIVYYQDINLASIVIITGILFLIVMAIFFIIAFFIPILRNFFYILSSIGIFIVSFYMLHFNGKNAELTAGSIIVNRPFHKSVVIPKDSILKTEVVKNYNHSFRWIFPLMVIIMSLFFMNKIIDVSSCYFAGNYSLLDTISIIIMYIGLMSLYLSTYFKGKKISPYRSALKITAKLKNEVSLYVYVNDPQEMKNILEVNLCCDKKLHYELQ